MFRKKSASSYLLVRKTTGAILRGTDCQRLLKASDMLVLMLQVVDL